jgi:hypothetical protein
MWDHKATKAFNLLKKLMTKPSILSLPDLNKLFIIETDASMVGVRVVLIQDRHLIAYISKYLGPKQQTMSIYEEDMLVIMHVVTKLKHYMWGKHFKTRTNHMSLKYLLDQKIITPI